MIQPGTPATPAQVDQLPLPVVSPSAINPGIIQPLTAGGKVGLMARNTFGPRAIVNRVLQAGLNHWTDSPREWNSSWDGYGRRLGTGMGRLAVRNSIQLATDVAFKLEPRYDRCDCIGAKSRSLHAIRRVVIARRDDGTEMLHVTRFAGAYATPFITNQWMPDRLNTTSNSLLDGTSFLGFRVLGNMVKEFWPEIKRKARFIPGDGPGN